MSVWRRSDHITTCMYLHVSFEVCVLPCSLQRCLHVGTVVSGRRDHLLYPSSFSLSLLLSNARSLAHPRSLLWQASSLSAKQARYHCTSALVLVLVREPNRREPKRQFFPQNWIETDRPWPAWNCNNTINKQIKKQTNSMSEKHTSNFLKSTFRVQILIIKTRDVWCWVFASLLCVSIQATLKAFIFHCWLSLLM